MAKEMARLPCPRFIPFFPSSCQTLQNPPWLRHRPNPPATLVPFFSLHLLPSSAPLIISFHPILSPHGVLCPRVLRAGFHARIDHIWAIKINSGDISVSAVSMSIFRHSMPAPSSIMRNVIPLLSLFSRRICFAALFVSCMAIPTPAFLFARRTGGLASRVRPLRANIRPRVRHFVYCVRIIFGRNRQTRRPARFVLNADVIFLRISPDVIGHKKTAATSLLPLSFVVCSLWFIWFLDLATYRSSLRGE